MEGAILGPLLICLLTDQFERIKAGDSYWYERRVGPQQFTKGGICSKELFSLSRHLTVIILFTCFRSTK